MRALILDGALIGSPSPRADAPLSRFRSGETVFGRSVRLLAGHGVRNLAVISASGADRLQEQVDRLGSTSVDVSYLPSASIRQGIAQMLEFLAGGDQVLILADDLVFSAELLELLLEDTTPHVALCGDESSGGPQLDLHSASSVGASGQVSLDSSVGLKVLARNGVLDVVGADLTGGGSRSFWPMFKLSGPAAVTWLEQLAGSPEQADTGVAALNRIADDLRIRLQPASGRFVARVGQGRFDELAERTRLSDLRQQRVIAEPRGYVRLGAELARLGITRPLLVAEPTYGQRDIAGHVGRLNVEIVRFERSSAVPTRQEVLAAIEAFRTGGCDGVLTVGGAAAISLGKLTKLYAGTERPLEQPAGFSAIGHLVVPTAGGSGGESTTEAVIEVEGGLQRIRQDCLLPDVVLLDPTVWGQDTETRRRSAVLGALSRSMGSAWAATPTQESRQYALSSLDLLLDSLFGFVRGDVPEAQLSMLTAVNLSGRAATLSGPSMMDALSYSLAQRLGVEPDEAAALCLPAVWRLLAQRITTDPDIARAAAFRQTCDLLSERLGAENVHQAVTRVERIIALLRQGGEWAPGPSATGAPAIGDALELSPLPLTPDDIRAAHDQTLLLATQQQPERTDLGILTRFSVFCRARNLNCYLFGQTLRDAVTVGRLSPWSGPITVAMPRTSYLKLVRWRDQLPADLWLDDALSNPARSTVSPRLVWSAGDRPSDPDALPGITIRVLESANYGSQPTQLARRSALMLLHRAILAAENTQAKPSAGLSRTVGEWGKRLGIDRLGRLRVRWTENARRRPGVHTYVDPGLTSEFARSQFLAVWFGKGGEQELNGQVFQAPVQPDAVLNRLFGAGFGAARTIPTEPVPSVPAIPVEATTAAEPAGEPDAPVLSVIVPVYNVEQFLPECLDSLCLQDTDGYEIIAVDDGSPDGSLEILREYEQRFPELLRVVRKPNGGLSDARNFGMQFARGEYVGFVDSDDLVMPSMIRLMKAKAAATDADIVVCNHAEYWAGSGRADVRWMSYINSYGHSVGERPELLIAVHPYAWNKIYRRRLFHDYDISYPKGQAFEDSATTFNLMLQANKIEYVDEALYFYRMDRADSITNTFNEKFYDIFKSFDSIREFYRRHGRYDEFREEISELMRRTSFARVTALESCRDLAGVEAFLTAVYDYLDRHAPDWAQNKYFRRQMSNPKYYNDPKYRSMHSRTLMLEYFKQLWQNQGDDINAAQQYTTMELIRMLQQEELEILLRIDRFCAERGLTYYLAEGTLLGAIRHQGFIPWDDDVDIAMPRADYERFLDALERNEDPELRLFHDRTYPRYHLTFAKVLSTRPSGFTNTKVVVPAEFQGPCVDVFPLDVAPRRRDPRVERRTRWLRDMLLFKVDFMSEKAKKKKYRTYYASKVYPFRYLQRAIQRLYRYHEGNPKATYLVNFASSYPVDQEKVKAARYGEPRRVPFEGYELPVPSDWDAVLRTTYGNYMELPPPGDREPRHRPRWRDPAGD